MARTQSPELLPLVQSFFEDHLERHCGASHHTVRAYRDTLTLLFRFLADRLGCAISDLRLDDLHVESVKAFLVHLENERANTAATRNYRLTAVRSFFRHLIRQDLSRANQYQRVLALPSKRARTAPAPYLEPEDVRLILRQPDGRKTSGRRDRALLIFLYNTGARVSEAIAVRVQDLYLIRPTQVRLQGKGDKVRHCPLWRETVEALQQLPSVRDGSRNDPVFQNRNGQLLTRDGIAYILNKHVAGAARQAPALRRRHITPHCLRHSCAVALLQAGVDITVIRDYLGHASIATTSRYITTNLRMKRDAMEVFWERAGLTPRGGSSWEPKPDLMAFLESL